MESLCPNWTTRKSPGRMASRMTSSRPSSMKLFELRPFTAWLETFNPDRRKNGSAMPHPVSGAASAYFCAAVESPAIKIVRSRRAPPRETAADAGPVAATASGTAASAAVVTCLRVSDTCGCLSQQACEIRRL